MRKAVIFDRDGTLIVDRIYLNDPKQIEYLPGVFDALRLLVMNVLRGQAVCKIKPFLQTAQDALQQFDNRKQVTRCIRGLWGLQLFDVVAQILDILFQRGEKFG